MTDLVRRGPASVRVVRGKPDEIELAALVAGLAAGSAAGAAIAARGTAPDEHSERQEAARLRWRNATQGLDRSLRPGPDAWRWTPSR